MGQSGSLGGDPFENVVYEAVHDAHCLTRNSSVGMNLLQDLVDVDRVTFLPPALLFLVTLRDILLRLTGFFCGLTAGLGWHISIGRTLGQLSLDDETANLLKNFW